MRNALMAIVLPLLPLSAGCGGQASSAVGPADCQATALHKVGSTPAVDVVPPDSTIRGLLVDGPTATAGKPFGVRWVMDARKAGPEMRMRAIREGTNQTLEEAWRGTTAGQLAQFPARITFPRAGCWSADVSSGTGGGEVVLRVNQ
jgi:hypothetical protein